MSHTINSAIEVIKSREIENKYEAPGWENVQDLAMRTAKTAQALLNGHTPEEIREYLDITRSILNDLETRMNEEQTATAFELEQVVEPAIEEKPRVATKQEEPVIREEVKALIEEEKVTIKRQNASRVKRSKQVDTIVENTKGRRDVNAGDKQKIDAAKEAAAQFKPEKVQQEKRKTKKAATPKAEKAKKEKRTHNGMSYAETRKQVSERKAKLNKADQERMAKAGLKNNTWDGAIESLAWLNKYFPAK